MSIALEHHRLYSIGDIAEWMGVKKRWLWSHRAQLDQRGFPAPIPKPGRPRWRGEALLAWSRQDAALKAALVTPGTNVHDLGAIAAARSKALPARRKAS